MRMRLLLLVCGVSVGFLSAQPKITAVVNSASGDYAVAPGSLVSVYGEGFGALASAEGVPLPRKLSGASLTINNIDLPLLFVSSNQINAQLPFELPVSASGVSKATVTVTTPAGKSAAFDFMLLPAAPGLFTESMNGQGPALVFDGGFNPVKSVTPGQIVIVYATGLGATKPQGVTGESGAAAEPLNRAVLTSDVFIGERKAEVLYAGLTPWPGVYQMNIAIPNQRLLSDRVYLRAKGWQSNIASVGVPQGETAGVTGSITPLYPVPPQAMMAGESPVRVTYSPALVSGKFSLAVDAAASEAVYDIAVVSEAGSAILQVKPGASFESLATVPTAASRVSDFSPQTDVQTVEMLMGCCYPTPGNIIPMSRVDPREVRTLSLIPLPNEPGVGGGVGTFHGMRQLAPQTSFAIDDSTNAELSSFAGYANVPFGLKRQKVFPFRLYVNGKLIASSDVTADVAGQ